MKIDVNRIGGVALMNLSGRLDIGTLASVEEEIDRQLEFGLVHCVLRLLDVTDISSSGLARILALKNKLDKQQGSLLLLEPSPVVEYVLDLAEMKDHFRIFGDEQGLLYALGAVGRARRPDPLAALDTHQPQ